MSAIDFLQAGFLAIARAGSQAALLGLIVLAVQLSFRKKLLPTWRYLLWTPVVLRLLFPVLPESPLSLFNLASSVLPERRDPAFILTANPEAAVVLEFTRALDESSSALPNREDKGTPPRKSFPWLSVLALLSVAGALFFALCFSTGTLRLRRRLQRSGKPLDPEVKDLFNDVRGRFSLRRKIDLIETGEVDSPALFGFVRAHLLLPPGLVQALSRDELRHVFAHECAHLKRGDLWTNALLVLLQTIHWWNPFVWLFFNRIRADRELACDHLALAHLNPGAAQDYGRTLLRLLEGFGAGRRTPVLVGILEEKSQLKERVRGIAGFRVGRKFSWLAAALLAGLVLTGLSDAERKLPQKKENEELPQPVFDAGENSGNNERSLDLFEAANRREREKSGGLVPETSKGAPRVLQRFRIDPNLSAADQVRALQKLKLDSISFSDQTTLKEALLLIEEQLHRNTGVTNPGLFRFQTPISREEIQKQFGDRAVAVNAVGYIEYDLRTPGTFGEQVKVQTGDLEGMQLSEALDKIVEGADRPIGYSSGNGFVFFQHRGGKPGIGHPSPEKQLRKEAFEQLSIGQTNEARRLLSPLPDAEEVFLQVEERVREDKETRGEIPVSSKQTQVDSAAPSPEKTLTIEITLNGEYLLGGEKFTYEELEREFARKSQSAKPMGVYIRAHQTVPFAYVAKLIELCRTNGVTNVNFATRVQTDVEVGSRVRSGGTENTLEPAQRRDDKRDEKKAISNNSLIQDARLLIEMGKLDEAEAKLREALKNDPETRSALYYLTLVEEQRGAMGRSRRKTDNELLDRPLLLKKLENLIIPEFSVRTDEKLANVIRDLSELAKKVDPQVRGINFLISSGTDDSSGNPSVSKSKETPKQTPLEDYLVKIDPALRNVSLAQIVQAIAKVARSPGEDDRKLDLRIEDYAVVFAIKSEQESLYARTYKVDPRTFESDIRNVLTSRDLTGTVVPEPTLQEALVKFFALAGVQFNAAPLTDSSGKSAPPQKAIFYNDRSGVLFVRATLRELEIVESALHALSLTPPLVELQSTMVELPRDYIERNLVSTGHTMTNPAYLSGLLNEAQHELFFNTLSRNGNTGPIALPKVTTVSGREARTSEGAQADEIIDLLPYVATDGYTLELSATLASIDKAPAANALLKDRENPIRATRRLFDGQTLVFGVPLPNKPGQMKVIFVTPKIVDPAGNPIYAGRDRPYDERLFPR
jgi:beta-lactamase regulating signal transducer with metallopeptidase domain/biopolymer transport protein ExbD